MPRHDCPTRAVSCAGHWRKSSGYNTAMNAVKQICLLLIATIFLLCRCATAAPAPVNVPAPYLLTLSLNGADLMLTVTNLTQHTLYFGWTGGFERTIQFHVDFKTPAADPSPNSRWTPLKSNAKPVPKPGTPDVVTHTDEHGEKILLAPGHNAAFPVAPDFPMAAPGFYRITLTMTIPQAPYLGMDSPISSIKEDPGALLVIHSNTLVVRQTQNGFEAVSKRS